MMTIEKSFTSQHGEDGIIEFMIQHLKETDKTFLEIGWGNGKHNMSYNLICKGWSGVGIDLIPCEIKLPNNVKFIQKKISPNDIKEILTNVNLNLDFFSLDIDSYDYDICIELLKLNFRPKIVCVEINKKFGNTVEAHFPYVSTANKKTYHKIKRSGVSLKKYINLWEHIGYKFFTCDSSYTNAFFYNPTFINDINISDARLLENMPEKNDKIIDFINENEFWKKNIPTIYSPFSLNDLK